MFVLTELVAGAPKDSGKYIHDPAGDRALPYKHDPRGDTAEPYVHDKRANYKHDPSGDKALPYKHDKRANYKHDPSGDKALPYKHDKRGETRTETETETETESVFGSNQLLQETRRGLTRRTLMGGNTESELFQRVHFSISKI